MSQPNCRCDICNAVYVMTPGGYGTCPHGHGWLILGVTQRRINARLSLEKATVRKKERKALRKAALVKLRLLPLCYYDCEASSWHIVRDEAWCYRRVAGPFAASTLDKQDDYLRAGLTIARIEDDRWCVLKEIV